MAARFCAVGILSTAVHLTVALSLVVFAGTDAVVANCSAFLCAFLVSFFGHFHWTFNKRSARARSFVRFAGIALASLAANNLVLIGLIDVANTARECAVLTAVLVVLPVTYLSNRLWGFSDLESGRPLASNGAAWPSYLSALALGALFAFWLFPADFILGESAYWSAPEGDPMAHVIGMRYFLADEWRFPLFQTRLIAPPEGVNIIFTDSLPLFALIAKLLRPWLSEQVNYFGIWYFSVYVLQAVAAVFLLRSLDVKSLLPNLAGAAIALSFPPFLFRIYHMALCGHFLVLFALGLYFRSVRRAAFGRLWGWFALLCGLALLVHAYLFVMVFGVFAAAAVQEALSSRAGLRNGLIAGVVIAAECVLLMWISGYFHGAGANGGGGFGVYSMNLLSPWVPQLSGLFPAMDRVIDSTGGQYEGFNYLGFGILLLLGAALWAGRSEIPAALGRYWGLGGLLLGFAALAVTHRVFLGSWKLLEIDLDPPSFLQQLRSSGRFFWPVGYTLMALGVAVAARKMRRPVGILLISVAALLQLADTASLRDRTGERALSSRAFSLPVEPWRPLIAAHERLTIVPSFHCADPVYGLVLELAFHASSSMTPTNTTHLARTSPADCAGESASLRRHAVDGGELLVVLSPPLNPALAAQVPDFESLCRSFQGGFACSRHWSALARELTLGFSAPAVDIPFYALGDEIRFSEGGNSGGYTVFGWSAAEPWGTWTEGAESEMLLRLREPVSTDLKLTVRVHGFPADRRGEQAVEVVANGTAVGWWALRDGREGEVSAIIPRAVAAAPLLRLAFRIAHPASPKSLGLSEDLRQLGMGAVRMRIDPAGS